MQLFQALYWAVWQERRWTQKVVPLPTSEIIVPRTEAGNIKLAITASDSALREVTAPRDHIRGRKHHGDRVLTLAIAACIVAAIVPTRRAATISAEQALRLE